ncbi:MAG: hypothetical protein AAB553_07505 [Patescibacteria group bacterium]
MADERELLQQNWHQASNEAIYWNKMTNDKNTEITKQLLGVAALLIPLSGSVVITSVPLTDFVKTVLGGSLFFLFGSIIFGFIDISKAAGFFREYIIYNSKRATIYHNHLSLDSTLDKAEEEIRKLSQPRSRSEGIASEFQIGTISVGIVLLIIAITTLLILK